MRSGDMPETRRRYDAEFSEGGVGIVRETGKSIARSLGISGSMRARSGTG
jgi:hypothetical protein